MSKKVESVKAGQKLVCTTPVDKSSEGMPKGNPYGKMGGSPTNLDHSLKGASAVQRGDGKI